MIGDLEARAQERPLPALFSVLLALLVFSTFLSETRFLGATRNNIGAFEASAALMVAAMSFYWLKHGLSLRGHRLVGVMVAWFVVTLISLFKVRSQFYITGVIGAAALLFQIVFTTFLYTLLTRQRPMLQFTLRAFTASVVIVGVWVLAEQLADPGNYGSAIGPFRGRSHMGIYMMGGFWIALAYLFWPGRRRWERLATLAALGLALYAIAVALRQSVYAAMIFGFALLFAGLFLTGGRERLQIALFVVLAGLTALVLYQEGGNVIPQLGLFRREVDELPRRLRAAVATVDNAEAGETFDAMQRRGALRAFQENPIIGIGWMGFYRSRYSATGNELHSTPLRFLAELGLFGVAVYVAFMSVVVGGAMRLFWQARRTAYQASAMVMLAAALTFGVSHYYNRMFTDRPYWFFLVILLAFQAELARQAVATEVEAEATAVPSLALAPATD